MLEQQRRLYERINISRPLEIEPSTGKPRVLGYSRNLSEAGVLARVDEALPVGRLCLVRLTLEDTARPADACAEIVWCRKDIYGSGAEVGLRLLAPDEAAAIPPRPDPRVSAGAVVQVTVEGIVYEARVTQGCVLRTGASDIELSLVLGEPVRLDGPVAEASPTPESDADLLAAAEEWRPKPLEEAWLAVRRYTLPMVVVLGAIAGPLFKLLRRGVYALCAKAPLRYRERASVLWTRLNPMARGRAAGKWICDVCVHLHREIQARRSTLVRSASRPDAASKS